MINRDDARKSVLEPEMISTDVGKALPQDFVQLQITKGIEAHLMPYMHEWSECRKTLGEDDATCLRARHAFSLAKNNIDRIINNECSNVLRQYKLRAVHAPQNTRLLDKYDRTLWDCLGAYLGPNQYRPEPRDMPEFRAAWYTFYDKARSKGWYPYTDPGVDVPSIEVPRSTQEADYAKLRQEYDEELKLRKLENPMPPSSILDGYFTHARHWIRQLLKLQNDDYVERSRRKPLANEPLDP